MPYSTGVASSPIDLLQKLVLFLTGIGWNSDLSASDGSGWRAHLDLNGNFVHLRASMNESSGVIWDTVAGAGYSLNLYTSGAFNGANAWNQQPGTPPLQNGSSTKVVGAAMPLPSGAIQGYFFFSDSGGDNVVVVVEKSTGVYVHLGWGPSLIKNGTWTGGSYFFGTACGFEGNGTTAANPSPGYSTSSLAPGVYGDFITTANAAFVRADVDAFTGKWIGIGPTVNAATGYTGKNGASPLTQSGATPPPANIPSYSQNLSSTQFQFCQTSELDGRANLLPILLWAARDSGGYSPIGSIPNVFSANAVGSGFAAEDEYTIGSTTYKLFPNFAVIKQ